MKSVEAFKLVGATQPVEGRTDFAPALSADAPLVAESWHERSDSVLRVSNYETGEAVGQATIPHTAHTVSFAPGGRLLLAMPGGKGAWNTLLVYSEPWGSAPVLEDKSFGGLHHGAWLDEGTILVAGRAEYKEIQIAVLDVGSATMNVVYRERLRPGASYGEDNIDDAFCSPSGLVAFGIGFGRRVALYQLAEDRKVAVPQLSFEARYDGYGMKVAVAEDGQTIICASGNYQRHHPVALFDRHGRALDTLSSGADSFAYRHGAFCFGKAGGYGGSKVEVYRVRDGNFRPWCSREAASAEGCDLSLSGGRMLLALGAGSRAEVYELEDPDVLELASESADERRDAARRLGARRHAPAVTALARCLGDDSEGVQVAAAWALAAIGDAGALPQMLRALGHKPSALLRQSLGAALRRFPTSELLPSVLDCLGRSGAAYRRGAAHVLESMPSLNALNDLCEAIHDADREVRLSSANALRSRTDLRACVALLSHLNDEDAAVRLAVQGALARILEANKLLSPSVGGRLSAPMDIAAYAGAAISSGRMRDFGEFKPGVVSEFLIGLAAACLRGWRALPPVLNAIESLAARPELSGEPASASIGLLLALIYADALREAQQSPEAAGVYQQAVVLAQRLNAPQIEWRAWYAAGECFEAAGDDPIALTAYRHAMGVIDRLWFDLLEEDRRRDFFQDKALLYDRAALCCLRLGYKELALECSEKAKTRYLGDLIARRHLNPRAALEREVRELWEHIGQAHSVRVPAATSHAAGRGEVEIVAVQWGVREGGSGAVKPAKLAVFQEACQERAELRWGLDRLRGIWRLLSHVATLDDELIHQRVEQMYQALLPLQQAVAASELPVPSQERGSIIEEFDAAARDLNQAGSNDREAPFWIFSEYGHGWVEEICLLDEADERALYLEAVMEALNSVLHHEPVLGVSTASGEEEEETEGVLFVTRRANEGDASQRRETTVIDTTLKRYSQTRWRHVTRLARGEISNYSEIAEALINQPRTAQLQFMVTEHGTVVYVTHGREGEARQKGLLPDLRGEEGLLVFTCPEVTLQALRRLMSEAEDGWLQSYRRREQPQGRRAWMEAMDNVLRWMYERLISPLDAHLKGRGIERLHIIPHRALHLIPFSAMYRIGRNGERQYLADDYEIVYAPSATLQQICRQRAKKNAARQGLTALANPTGDLPLATVEVEQAAAYFPDSQVYLWCGDEARREILKTGQKESVFHFCGHGRYNWEEPLASYLMFAGGEPLTLADLFAEEIALTETNLVVLSACETGLTDAEDLADEYLGIASGFMFAGAPSVLSTLWAVDDISSALLIGHFYKKYLRDNLLPGQALSAAQQWLREEADRPLVIKTIDSILTLVEKQRAQAPHGSEREDIINKQLWQLENRRELLLNDEKHESPINPFAHPYYWAAFIFSGVGT